MLMLILKEFLKKLSEDRKNVSRWMGSGIEKMGDYIQKNYSPPEVAMIILLSISLIYLFIQILEDYFEEQSRKKK